jgi:cobalamin biosynthesis protein CobD/CbiB
MQQSSFGSLSKKIIFIGAIIMLLGVAFLSWLAVSKNSVTDAILVSLVWVVAVMLIVITAYMDELSSELKGISREHVEEVKLMRAEVNLVRYELSKIPGKKSR